MTKIHRRILTSLFIAVLISLLLFAKDVIVSILPDFGFKNNKTIFKDKLPITVGVDRTTLTGNTKIFGGLVVSGTVDLPVGSIQASDIASNIITSDKIATGSITELLLAPELLKKINSVTEPSNEISSVVSKLIITNDDIAENAITFGKIADNTITNADLTLGAFTNITRVGTLSGLTVEGILNLPAQSITSTEITNNTIKNSDLENGSFSNITGIGTLSSLILNGALTLANSETFDTSTDGQFTFGRNDAGTVTITAKDNDSSTAIAILPAGAAGLTLGDSLTTSIIFNTDSGGDAEIVLPAGAINSAEILDNTITNSDLILGAFSNITGLGTLTGLTINGVLTLANSETIDAANDGVFTLGRNDAGVVTLTTKDNDAIAGLTILPGGAGPLTLGGSSTTVITFLTDGTGDGEVVLPAGAIDGTEILDSTITATDINDVTQSINIPIGSLFNTGTIGLLPIAISSITDGLVAAVSGHAKLQFKTGAASTKIGGTFVVPQDYVSGGTFKFSVTKDAETASQAEQLKVGVSINNSAETLGSAVTVSGAAIQTINSAVGTYAVGDAVSFEFSQIGSSANDNVFVHSIEWQYTASQ